MGETDTANVVGSIIEYIQKNNLRIGDRLPSIRKLSESTGVGRNAIRDGLMQAKAMGLLKILPRSGAFVQSLDLSSLANAFVDTIETAILQKDASVIELMEARIFLECDLAALAASRRRLEDMYRLRQTLDLLLQNWNDRAAYIEQDESFHLTIANIAGNSVMYTVLKSLLTLLRPTRIASLSTPETMELAASTHNEVFKTILDGDPERARKAMWEHLFPRHQNVLDHIKDMLPVTNSGFVNSGENG